VPFKVAEPELILVAGDVAAVGGTTPETPEPDVAIEPEPLVASDETIILPPYGTAAGRCEAHGDALGTARSRWRRRRNRRQTRRGRKSR